MRQFFGSAVWGDGDADGRVRRVFISPSWVRSRSALVPEAPLPRSERRSAGLIEVKNVFGVGAAYEDRG